MQVKTQVINIKSLVIDSLKSVENITENNIKNNINIITKNKLNIKLLRELNLKKKLKRRLRNSCVEEFKNTNSIIEEDIFSKSLLKNSYNSSKRILTLSINKF